jgi:hypothetical protein
VGNKLVRTKTPLGLLGTAIALPPSGWADDEAAAPGSPCVGRTLPTHPCFGDTHPHTSFSMDAGAFGACLDPGDAYCVLLLGGDPRVMADPLGRKWHEMWIQSGQGPEAA